MGKIKENIRQKYINTIMSNEGLDVLKNEDENYLTFLQSLTIDELKTMVYEKANIPNFIENIDFKLLREQKDALLMVVVNNVAISDKLNGIVHLLDALQDYCVDDLGYCEEEVFGDLDAEEVTSDE